MKKNALILLATTALLAGAIAQTGRAEFRANMAGQGKGKASWKTRDSGSQFQAELQVEGENLSINTTYRVRILTNTWNVTTDALGRYSLVRLYTTANRPAIVAGTEVKLYRTNGTLAQSGAFVRTK